MTQRNEWWLFILGDQVGVDWVLSTSQMAFVSTVCPRAQRVNEGDVAFLYATKAAFKGSAQHGAIFARTRVLARPRRTDDPVILRGVEYACTCPLELEHKLREGLPLAPIVDRLTFIRNKKFWGLHLRTGIVRLPAEDGELLASELESLHKAQT